MKKAAFALPAVAALIVTSPWQSPEVYGQEDTSNEEASLYETIKSKATQPLQDNSLVQGLELDASVVLDGFYYHEDSEEGMTHLKEEISGFGHSHNHEGHSHGELENGFNLRHIELGLSAAVDPYFRAWTTLAFDDGSNEIEEAVIQTTSLPAGFTLSAGKLFSGIGRLNRQHSHNWDFYDQPLIYETLLGGHNLVEKGVQLTWLAPTPFYLLLGAEALNGENEKMFQKVDSEELPEHEGPRLWTGFMKISPNLGEQHALQFGMSCALGKHQEAHASDTGEDDEHEHEVGFDHWLDGESQLWGLDLIYKYDARKEQGQGDFVVQAEYLNRQKDMEIIQHYHVPAVIGRKRKDTQDGYYLQALYGFLPRWRAGVRWEEIGLTNEAELPNLTTEEYDSSTKATAMLDWKLSEFSLVRLQTAQVDFSIEDGSETVWETALQLQVTFGKHAAHDF